MFVFKRLSTAKGFTNTQFFTPSGTIDLLEEKYNQFYYNSLQTNFTLKKHNKKLFQKQSEFQGFWDSQREYRFE
jgi:hypothetical protein